MLYFDVICYIPILWCRAPFGHHKKIYKAKLRHFLEKLLGFPSKIIKTPLKPSGFKGVFGAAGGIRTLVRLPAN